MDQIGSAAAIYGGTFLAKKTFEFFAGKSLVKLFSNLESNFKGQKEFEDLRSTLESRLQVLSLPVTVCVQYVLRGNTMLQGALQMTMEVLDDITGFEEELEQQVVLEHRKEGQRMSAAQAIERLRSFLPRLDAVIPYLTVAVNTVSLLSAHEQIISSSRLMEASYLVRSSEQEGDNVILKFPGSLIKYVEHLNRPCWQQKLMHSQVTLSRVATAPGDYRLAIHPTEDETGDQEDCESLDVHISDLIALGSSTLHVLGLGQNALEPVLLIDISKERSTQDSPTSKLAGEPQTPAPTEELKAEHYAIQHSADLEEDDEDSSDERVASSSTADSTPGSTAKAGARTPGSLSDKTSTLSKLEYALRLCMLENQEGVPHWLVEDERLQIFFQEPRYLAEPVPTVQTYDNKFSALVGRQWTTPRRRKTPTVSTPQQTTPARRLSSASKSAALEGIRSLQLS